MKLTRFPYMALAACAVAAIALSGCGGSSSKTAPPPAAVNPIASLANVASKAAEGDAFAEMANAADQAPVSGSVSQASANSITGTDGVRVAVTYASDKLKYVVEFGPDGSENATIDSSDATNVTVHDETPGTGDYAGLNSIQMSKDVTVGSADGTLHVDLFTDRKEETTDADYLALGLWAWIPDDNANDPQFGVFADGSAVFDQNTLQGLTGAATYAGTATGAYADDDADTVEMFSAEASFTAAFGRNTEDGTIYGTISKFSLDDYKDAILKLGSSTSLASIGAANGGFFVADTSSMTVGSTDFTGDWGGQFYGGGNRPSAFIGTFGAATSDDAKSFIGVFLTREDTSN